MNLKYAQRVKPGVRALCCLSLPVILILSVAVEAQPLPAIDEEPVPAPPIALRDLAGQADLIAAVQVLDTDYEYARKFPTGGTAFLKTLIPYKTNQPVPDIIEVYEEGLHPNECYFPNPSPIEEGQRFLIFVRENPEVEGQYLRLEQGCALQILVSNSNEYVLRYPANDIALTDDLSGIAQTINFRDNYAVVDDDVLTVGERNALLSTGDLELRDDGQYFYTRGITLSNVRQLLGEENLTRDRALLRPAPIE